MSPSIDHIYTTLEQKDTYNNYWEQYIYCFAELIKASDDLGADLMSQLYITNLTEDKGSFNFNPRFMELCIDLITKAQMAKQIKNQKPAKNLFIASSFMFTGLEALWSMKKGGFERKENMMVTLETMFDVAPEFSMLNETRTLDYSDFQ